MAAGTDPAAGKSDKKRKAFYKKLKEGGKT